MDDAFNPLRVIKFEKLDIVPPFNLAFLDSKREPR